jgi:hypothetical protein
MINVLGCVRPANLFPADARDVRFAVQGGGS